jgi:SsrA-binding protein
MAYNFSVNKKTESPETPRLIAVNRRARFDYFIEERFEAGLVLQGWEVKSLREGRAQIVEAYVRVLNGELWLIGAHFTPPSGMSTHVHPDPTRTRKLLVHAKELSRLIGKVERAGYTLIPIDLHWARGRAKLEFGLAKGKKAHDKRAAIKDRDWQRQKSRLLRH